MQFFSIFSTSNDKNPPTSNMLNLKKFSISYSRISFLRPYCNKMLEYFNIFFFFSLPLSRVPCSSCFFSPSFPLSLSLLLIELKLCLFHSLPFSLSNLFFPKQNWSWSIKFDKLIWSSGFFFFFFSTTKWISILFGAICDISFSQFC